MDRFLLLTSRQTLSVLTMKTAYDGKLTGGDNDTCYMEKNRGLLSQIMHVSKVDRMWIMCNLKMVEWIDPLAWQNFMFQQNK